MIVYTHSSVKGSTTIKCTVSKSDDEKFVLKLEGTAGQYVVFVITHPTIGNIINTYQMSDDGEGMNRYKIKLPIHHYSPSNFYNYVYNCTDISAAGYAAAMPKHLLQSNASLLLSTNKSHNLYAIYYDGQLIVNNCSPQALEIDTLGVVSPGSISIFDTYQTSITNLIVKYPKTSFKDITFAELSYEEQKTMVPSVLSTGYLLKLSARAKYEWVPASEVTVTTTLTYKETHDKEYHMVDESVGRVYRYNIDAMRQLIPYLINGKITGNFIYRPCGGGKSNLNYVLIPLSHQQCKNIDTEYMKLCESDDSEIDQEDEPRDEN